MKNNVSETIQVTSSDLFLLKKYKVINLWVINLVLHVTLHACRQDSEEIKGFFVL